jgi:hypothetical protein
MRIAIALLVLAGTARAEDADQAFKNFVDAYAKENNVFVEAWWSANLDTDPALERVAIVCPTNKDATPKGYFLVEKDAAHRWELMFDYDSRTKACQGKAGAPPAFEKRKTTDFVLYQGHRVGYEETTYALRVGQPVIVKDVLLETEGGKPVVTDWDLLVKKKGKKYQVPDNLRQLN